MPHTTTHENKMILNLCPICVQMTNHDQLGYCLKCGKQPVQAECKWKECIICTCWYDTTKVHMC